MNASQECTGRAEVGGCVAVRPVCDVRCSKALNGKVSAQMFPEPSLPSQHRRAPQTPALTVIITHTYLKVQWKITGYLLRHIKSEGRLEGNFTHVRSMHNSRSFYQSYRVFTVFYVILNQRVGYKWTSVYCRQGFDTSNVC